MNFHSPRHFALVFTLLFLTILLSTSSQLVYSGSYHTGIVVDGNVGEWLTDEHVANETADDASFGSTNNLNDLYVTWDSRKLYLRASGAFEAANTNGFVVFLDLKYSASGNGGADLTALTDSTGALDALITNPSFSESDGNFLADYAIGSYQRTGVSAGNTPDGAGMRGWGGDGGRGGTASSFAFLDGVDIAFDGAGTEAEIAVSWDKLYGVGEGKVPTDAQLALVIGYGNTSGGASDETLPTNGGGGGGTFSTIYVVDVDSDDDGFPDVGVRTGDAALGADSTATPTRPNNATTPTSAKTIDARLDDWGQNEFLGAGTNAIGAESQMRYFLSWDASNIYAAFAGLGNGASDQFNVLIDTDPGLVDDDMNIFNGVKFNDSFEPDYAYTWNGSSLVFHGASSNSWSSMATSGQGADSSTDPVIVEIAIPRSELGVLDGPVGFYLYAANNTSADYDAFGNTPDNNGSTGNDLTAVIGWIDLGSSVNISADRQSFVQRYVATGGSDTTNDCSANGTPCATFSHAVTQSNPGDSITSPSGTYIEDLTIDKALAFQGNGATPIINGEITVASGGRLAVDRLEVVNMTINSGGILAGHAYNSNSRLVVTGDWSHSGSFLHEDGQVRFDGSGTRNISGDANFYDLVLAANTSWAANTFTIDNDLQVNSGNPMTPGTSTFVFAGPSGSLTGSGDKDFYDVSISSGASLTHGDGDVTINRSFTNDGTFTAHGTAVITLLGDWTNNGTFDDNSGTVGFFNGTNAQSIGGTSPTTFNNLTIGNGSTTGVTLNQDGRVEGTLTLGSGTISNGRLTVDDQILTLGPSAAVVAGSGALDASRMITAEGSGAAETCTGQLVKEFTGSGSFTFPLGDDSGTIEYTPFDLTFTSGTFGSAAAVAACVTDLADSTRHPADSVSSEYLTRYWTVTETDITSFSADVTFHYQQADVEGTEALIFGQKYDSTNWTFLGSVNAIDDEFSATVTNFSDFYGGSATLPVTLAHFKASRVGDAVQFEWQTATETGNVGFNLYAQTADGRLPLNDHLIPSAVFSSADPQTYRLEIDDAPGETFFIEDVDFRGRATGHGPFALGQSYGRPIAVDPINWAAIRAEQAAAAAARPVAVPRSTGPQAQLAVDQTGLHRVSHADLLAAGFDLTGAAVADLALTNQGQPAPITVESAGPAFAPGDQILFHGRALDTLYTKTNLYTLHLDPALAVRIPDDPAAASAPPAVTYQATAVRDDNLKYDVVASGTDPWYLARLVATAGRITQTFTIDAPDTLAGTVSPTLSVEMWGATLFPETPDHHVIVSFNGQQVADETFDGLAAHTTAVALPAGLVQPGPNTVAVSLPYDLGLRWDVVALEQISLDYARAFVAQNGRLTFESSADAYRVTDLPDPAVAVYRLDGAGLARLTGTAVTPNGPTYDADFAGTGSDASYLVAADSALLTPAISPLRPAADITGGTAQYLMLAHASFIPDLAPLVAFHQGRGLDVRVVDVADVYDQFNHGIFDPAAINAYLQHAAANMGTEYVLLVGGDTYDYHDYLGQGSISFIPSPYTATGPIARFAPVDPRYADVDGDDVPDLRLGRFPVRTTAELQSVIDKTLAFATGARERTGVLAADAGYGASSDAIAAQLPADWQMTRAYLDQMPAAAARALLIDEMNDGVLLSAFFGHSGPTTWTFDGLFSAADAAALTNAGQPTLVTQFGCWNTYHVSPNYNTMGHTFMLSGDRGAAAVLGASTLTDVASDRLLGDRVLAYLGQPGMTVGRALQLAKEDLAASNPGLLDIQLGYTILGDPALEMSPATPTAVTVLHAAGHNPPPGVLPAMVGLLVLLTAVALGRTRSPLPR